MPKIKSAKKALRKSFRRRAQNLKKKRALRTEIKKYRRLVTRGDVTEARKKLAVLYKLLDKAAKATVIKRNASRRLKSRLARMLARK